MIKNSLKMSLVIVFAVYVFIGISHTSWQYYQKNGGFNALLNAGGLPESPLKVLLWPMDVWPAQGMKENGQSVYDQFLDALRPAQLSEAKPDSKPAPSTIEICHDKVRPKFDSGVTTTMIEGNVEYARCLEKAILKQSERIYPKAEWQEVKVQLQTQLKQTKEAVSGFYYRLQNQNQWCEPSCGTMWHVTYSSPYHTILENMITEMQRVERTHTE